MKANLNLLFFSHLFDHLLYYLIINHISLFFFLAHHSIPLFFFFFFNYKNLHAINENTNKL